MINAVEHGNLGIGYELKTILDPETTWLDEIRRRAGLEENKNKKVRVFYENTNDRFCVKIVDEGEGFDWSKYLELDPQRAVDGHGRGIAYANTMSFDKIIFNDKGNEVSCIINHNDDCDDS